jgi:hypothetical protein
MAQQMAAGSMSPAISSAVSSMESVKPLTP